MNTALFIIAPPIKVIFIAAMGAGFFMTYSFAVLVFAGIAHENIALNDAVDAALAHHANALADKISRLR